MFSKNKYSILRYYLTRYNHKWQEMTILEQKLLIE